jgi:cob(I)alamin adenosyltransferase
MSIITKQGDKGKTRLYSGEVVSKSDARIDTYGTIDELISFLGLAKSFCKTNEVNQYISDEQKRLTRLCAELATIDESKVKITPIGQTDVDEVEKVAADISSKVTLPKEFVMPGKNSSSSAIDVCRTICRRLERLMVGFSESGEWKNEKGLIYINRLSDCLFLMARLEEG